MQWFLPFRSKILRQARRKSFCIYVFLCKLTFLPASPFPLLAIHSVTGGEIRYVGSPRASTPMRSPMAGAVNLEGSLRRLAYQCPRPPAGRGETVITPAWFYPMKYLAHWERVANGRWEHIWTYLCVLIRIKTIDSGHSPMYIRRRFKLGKFCSAFPFFASGEWGY